MGHNQMDDAISWILTHKTRPKRTKCATSEELKAARQFQELKKRAGELPLAVRKELDEVRLKVGIQETRIARKQDGGCC